MVWNNTEAPYRKLLYEIGVLQKSTRASLFLVKLQFFTLVQVTLAQEFLRVPLL